MLVVAWFSFAISKQKLLRHKNRQVFDENNISKVITKLIYCKHFQNVAIVRELVMTHRIVKYSGRNYLVSYGP